MVDPQGDAGFLMSGTSSRVQPMRNYLLRRLLLMIPTLLGITVITFVIMRVAPGEPAAIARTSMEGGGPVMQAGGQTDELIRAKKALLGLDKPIPVQYLIWVRRVMTLDFGESFFYHQPVWTVIAEHIWPTLQINILTIVLVYLTAIPLGVGQAVRRGKLFDRATTVATFALYASPTYWIGPMLLIFLCNPQYCNWFPSNGLNRQFAEELAFFPWLGDRLYHLVLPILCQSYGALAYLSKQSRSGLLENLRADYVRTARAKGVSQWSAVFRHALRNSVIPIITIMAMILPSLIGGSIIIEMIFSIQGMGWLGFNAILQRDYPMIMATATIAAFLTLIGLLLQDLLYAWLDPRISYE